MKFSHRCLLGAAALWVLGTAARAQVPAQTQAGEDKPDATLTLKIGNPKLKDQTMAVAAGAVLSGSTGRAVGFDRMIAEMRASRFVHVGETHDSLPMHDIQFRVLEALYAQDRHLAVGMEMLPVSAQETLNKWSAGVLTKEEFIREVRWYVNWNFNFGYYEKIFDFAKEHRLPVYALNIPREIITRIRMRGWEALSGEEKALIPAAPDLSHQDHRTLIRTIFESADLPPQMKGPGLDQVFEGLYRSQSAWDEVMGANAVRGAASEGRRVVVCAGSGHLIYNLGLNRRAFERSGLPFKTVIAVAVPPEKSSVTVSRSFGDYVIGIVAEDGPAFPSVGLGFKNFENLTNLVVDPKPTGGEAAKAGFEKGDVVLSVDGKSYDDINEIRTYLARFRAGDKVAFSVLRSGQVKEVALEFGKNEPKD
ncbi:MAG: ChaN family lipoprotein [Candidatus Aminicenantes bacterium]